MKKLYIIIIFALAAIASCTKSKEINPTNGGIPEGAINSLFTINENGDRVYFSQGNLQYQASTNTWRFAEHQWDFVGGNESGGGGVSYQYDGGTVYENGVRCRNELISSTYDGWIDLFGWGTSGFNHGAICYQPWSISQESGDYFAYGNDAYSLYNMTGKADWGYNAIRNGGRINNVWRTLKSEEWDYILNNRYTVSGIKYAKATLVDFYEDEPSIMGLIIIPDDWSESYYTLMYTNSSNSSFLDNRISKSDWENIFEANGAVFLPVAGLRFGVINSSIMESAYYWSSSSNESLEGYMATSLTFSDNSVFTGHFYYHSYCVISGNGVGEAVRLVHDANK